MTKYDAALSKTAARMARLISKNRSKPQSIDVFLLPNRTLRQLKKKYLKKDALFVDLLAFPEPVSFPHPDRQGNFLGEVYLNDSLKAGPRRRLLYLLSHGVLHLLGYRHLRKSDTMEMEKMEQKLLRALL